MSHAHGWVDAGRRTLYVEFTRVVRGQHYTTELWANWVRCECGAEGFRRDHSPVVYVCDDWRQQ